MKLFVVGHRLLPWLILAAPLPACNEIATGDPSCAPAPATESWPIDPSALTPRPWPDAGPFSPAPHAPFPSLVDIGAGQLTPLRLVSIVTAGDPLHDALFAFGDALVRSQWLSGVAEAYGLAPTETSVHVDGPSLDGNVTVDDMKSYVQQAASSELAGPHAVYLLYLPPGATIVEGGLANCGCYALGPRTPPSTTKATPSRTCNDARSATTTPSHDSRATKWPSRSPIPARGSDWTSLHRRGAARRGHGLVDGAPRRLVCLPAPELPALGRHFGTRDGGHGADARRGRLHEHQQRSSRNAVSHGGARRSVRDVERHSLGESLGGSG